MEGRASAFMAATNITVETVEETTSAFISVRRNTAKSAVLLPGPIRGTRMAAGKPWAVAADNGLDAIDDPVAPYRRPVVLPAVDLKAAAKALDTGIYAYKVGACKLAADCGL